MNLNEALKILNTVGYLAERSRNSSKLKIEGIEKI